MICNENPSIMIHLRCTVDSFHKLPDANTVTRPCLPLYSSNSESASTIKSYHLQDEYHAMHALRTCGVVGDGCKPLPCVSSTSPHCALTLIMLYSSQLSFFIQEPLAFRVAFRRTTLPNKR